MWSCPRSGAKLLIGSLVVLLLSSLVPTVQAGVPTPTEVVDAPQAPERPSPGLLERFATEGDHADDPEPMGPPDPSVPASEAPAPPAAPSPGNDIPVPPGLPTDYALIAAYDDGTGPRQGGACACDEDAPKTASSAETVMAPHDPIRLAAAGLTLAALAGILVWRFVVPALAAAKALHLGYRIEREDLLAHPVRRRMLEHLEAHPGATAADLAAVSGVTYARATYHIAMLTREQAVRVQRVDHKKRYFPFAAPKADLESLRLQDLTRPQALSGRMMEFLRRAPGLTVSRLSRALGISPGHAHYHLSRLLQNGLLEAKRKGREVRYYLTDRTHAARTSHTEPVPA